jgi:hypothetical protein
MVALVGDDSGATRRVAAPWPPTPMRWPSSYDMLFSMRFQPTGKAWDGELT